MFVTEGKNNKVVADFVNDLKTHNGNAEQISQISCDMSPAFILGVEENLPNAVLCLTDFMLQK